MTKFGQMEFIESEAYLESGIESTLELSQLIRSYAGKKINQHGYGYCCGGRKCSRKKGSPNLKAIAEEIGGISPALVKYYLAETRDEKRKVSGYKQERKGENRDRSGMAPEYCDMDPKIIAFFDKEKYVHGKVCYCKGSSMCPGDGVPIKDRIAEELEISPNTVKRVWNRVRAVAG